MTIEKLLDKCEYAYDEHDFKRLIELSDDVLKRDPDNPIAISYKSISYCFLKRPDKAIEILDEAGKIHPENYYHKNILAMAYYDLGEYEKSLECCEEGLKIKDFEWLCENKVRALIRLDRVDEAIDYYEDSSVSCEITDLLIEGGKYYEALKYSIDGDSDGFNSLVDKIKDKDANALDDYRISWIYKIRSKSDTRFCPDCGGELIPIVWGLPHDGLLRKADRGEIFLGGCCLPPNPPNYHCTKCGGEFDLGVEGLHIECDEYWLYEYIEYKINQIASILKKDSVVFVRSKEGLKRELKGLDDEEFDAFISHLEDFEYIFEPREGYVKLVGYDDFKCAKEYLDDGKFAAPGWLVYPQLSAWTIGWRMGAGEQYAMNHPHHSKEYRELFPMPAYWQFRFSESPYKPHPVLGYFWNGDGKPKYPNVSRGIAVNAFITLEDEGEFSSDTFRFRSIEHAELLSKYLYFRKDGRKDADIDALRALKLTPEEEKVWDIYRYSVILNASYFKVMADDELKDKLLETGDEPLFYISDDEENLFGRALMELRDEIRRICKNEDLIDWEFTEYLKYKPWYD